jgi:hypothetical protein
VLFPEAVDCEFMQGGAADLPVVVHLRVSKPVLSLVCRLANWIAALSATRELFAHHLHA